MIKAAIFDVDGIIVDTDYIASLGYEKVLEQYSITPHRNKHGLTFDSGLSENDVWQLLKKRHGLTEDIQILKDKRNEIYKDLLKDLLPQPGLIRTLQMLKKHNIRLAVASSSLRAEMKLKTIDVHHFFETIVTSIEVRHGKPAPDIFLLTAEKLRVSPKECIVFEDAQSGVIAAEAAGMKVIAVPTQYTKKHDFSKASLIVDSLEKITYKKIISL